MGGEGRGSRGSRRDEIIVPWAQGRDAPNDAKAALNVAATATTGWAAVCVADR